MRVIDHKRLEELRERTLARRRAKRVVAALLVVIACVVFAVFYAVNRESPAPTSEISVNVPPEPPKKGVLRTYTPQQFRDLYNSFAYPNTQLISDQTPITGNQAIDDRIRSIAVQRGYLLRSAPVANTFQEVAPHMLLQQRAAQPWLDMQTAAKKAGLNLGLSAAYRSSAEQLSIFLSRFQPRQASPERVASGALDLQIIDTLTKTAPPGYSRHHTGYTVDVICDNNIHQVFDNTPCFQWLSADNYKNTKTYGWIPSYPEGTDTQGPEPESWEYVWVGVDTVTE